MKYYIVYISQEYVPKNNLHKEINKYMISIDRTIVPENRIIDLKKEIDRKIQELNEAHPRCKPVKPSWGRGFMRSKDDYHLYYCPTVSLSIIKTKSL